MMTLYIMSSNLPRCEPCFHHSDSSIAACYSTVLLVLLHTNSTTQGSPASIYQYQCERREVFQSACCFIQGIDIDPARLVLLQWVKVANFEEHQQHIIGASWELSFTLDQYRPLQDAELDFGSCRPFIIGTGTINAIVFHSSQLSDRSL